MIDNIDVILKRFTGSSIDSPIEETIKLINYLKINKIDDNNCELLKDFNIGIEEILEKRLKGVPFEYIFEKAAFMGNSFKCTGATLIPTEETSILVNNSIKIIKERQKTDPHQTMIDIGTGCGNIAISISLYTDNINIFATDISSEAIAIASDNVKDFSMDSVIQLKSGDLFEPFQDDKYKNTIDLIVCNPPYLPTKSIENLPSEIKDHEPIVALDAGPYGINIFSRLLQESIPLLKKDGLMLFEIGEGQETLVARMVKKNQNLQIIDHFYYMGMIRNILVQRQ